MRRNAGVESGLLFASYTMSALLLAVPLLGWRFGGADAAVAAAVAVAAFALLAAGLAPLFSRLLPRLAAREAPAFGQHGRQAEGDSSAVPPRRGGGLAAGLAALELAVGSWGIALAATVLLVLLLLAATQR